MNSIRLSNGLIVFGGYKDVETTRFLLKLSNFLAQSENVLFISYKDYKEHIVKIINDMKDVPEKKLEINTSFNHLNLGSFLELINYIESRKFSTVVIDDINSLSLTAFEYFDLNALVFMAKYLNIRIIFALRLEEKLTFTNTLFSKPAIKDFFEWSVDIVNYCSQIYCIHRLAGYGYVEDEDGESIVDKIEIISLKNDDCVEQSIILNNSILNIY